MTLQDLENPEFLAWVDATHGAVPVTPDKQDFKTTVSPHASDEEAANAYRLALVEKLTRLWKEWKANQN